MRSYPISRSLFAATVAMAVGFGCNVDSSVHRNPDLFEVPDAAPDPQDAGGQVEYDAGGGTLADAGAIEPGLWPCRGKRGRSNNRFADATRVEIGDTLDAAIEDPGDVDVYCFEASRSQWVRLYTSVSTGEGAPTDPVLKLYDAQGVQIASNDNAWTPVDSDAEIIIRLPYSGTYYLRATEGKNRGGEEYTYPLHFVDASPETGVFVESERGDSYSNSNPIVVDSIRRAVVGTFRDADDHDWFRFTIPTRMQDVEVAIFSGGPDDYGFTAPFGAFTATICESNGFCRWSDGATGGVGLNGAAPGTYLIRFKALPTARITDVTYGARITMTGPDMPP